MEVSIVEIVGLLGMETGAIYGGAPSKYFTPFSRP